MNFHMKVGPGLRIRQNTSPMAMRTCVGMKQFPFHLTVVHSQRDTNGTRTLKQPSVLIQMTLIPIQLQLHNLKQHRQQHKRQFQLE